MEQIWEPPILPVSLVTGALFHENLARKLRGEPLDFNSPLLARCDRPDIAVARAKAGLRLWKDVIGGQLEAIEEEISVYFHGFRWVGRLDALVRKEDGLFIVEHKLVSRPNWDWFQSISDQLMYYAWLATKAGYEDIRGGFWDIITVPELRRRIDEPLSEFENRLVDEALRRTTPVVAVPNVFTKEDLAFIEEAMTMISEEIRANKIFRNPQACAFRPCPYQLICRSDDAAEALGFIRKDLTSAQV